MEIETNELLVSTTLQLCFDPPFIAWCPVISTLAIVRLVGLTIKNASILVDCRMLLTDCQWCVGGRAGGGWWAGDPRGQFIVCKLLSDTEIPEQSE